MLIQETEKDMTASLSRRRGKVSANQRAKIFNRKMLRGDLRGAVKYMTETEKGGVLMPDDIDEKTGNSVAQTLESKHPDARIPETSSLFDYPSTPDFVDLDITSDVVEKVARRLSGSAGLGGVDSHALQHLLLQFGAASRKLRTVLANFASWMANGLTPWAAY